MTSDHAMNPRPAPMPLACETLAETLSLPLTMSMFATKADLHERMSLEREAAASVLSHVAATVAELRLEVDSLRSAPGGSAAAAKLDALVTRLEDKMRTKVPDPLPDAA